ncbi:ABC transporter permease [Blautia schinkii]|nr:ABC transporter permease [Blautia schinkii]
MLGKLAFRNAKRSLHDYFVYLLTMILITAMMFAFDAMIFSEAIRELSSQAGMMGMMIGLLTFFVVLIIVWLVHYMVKFIAEKRSREFATYLLLGFRKKQVAALFFRENVLMGIAAFVIGLFPGMFLQQVITTAIYAMLETDYQIRFECSLPALAMTVGIYAGAYLLALLRNQRRFRKMTINGMMNLERQNEEIKTGNKSGRQWMFWASLAFIALFGWMMITERFNSGNIYVMIIGLGAAVYLLYMGLAAFLVAHVRKKGAGVQQGANIFVYRQVASKIRTMQFTLGTLTLLFLVALVGASWALMLNQFQNTQGDEKFAFDVAVYNQAADYDFRREQELIAKEAEPVDELVYCVYQNGTSDWNQYLTEHNKSAEEYSYYKYDTYMRLSDYNRLRAMLGAEAVNLSADGYLLQTQERFVKLLEPMTEERCVIGGKDYRFEGIETLGFEQGGHNGADYVLVVPDGAADSMKPFYSLYAAELSGEAPAQLQEALDEITIQAVPEGEAMMQYADMYASGRAMGSGEMYMSNAPAFVRDTQIREMKFMMTSIIFPLFYIGMVFLLVAVTILSVQQLSDSSKYRFRYSVLRKLGMKKKELSHVIFKELSLYYLCPFIGSILISGSIVIYMSMYFVTYSGVVAPVWQYFATALALFGSIYLLYFAATYVGFKRNVYEERARN